MGEGSIHNSRGKPCLAKKDISDVQEWKASSWEQIHQTEKLRVRDGILAKVRVGSRIVKLAVGVSVFGADVCQMSVTCDR